MQSAYIFQISGCKCPNERPKPLFKKSKNKKPHTHSHTMTQLPGWQYQCNPADYTTIQLQSCSFTYPYPIWTVQTKWTRNPGSINIMRPSLFKTKSSDVTKKIISSCIQILEFPSLKSCIHHRSLSIYYAINHKTIFTYFY